MEEVFCCGCGGDDRTTESRAIEDGWEMVEDPDTFWIYWLCPKCVEERDKI